MESNSQQQINPNWPLYRKNSGQETIPSDSLPEIEQSFGGQNGLVKLNAILTTIETDQPEVETKKFKKIPAINGAAFLENITDEKVLAQKEMVKETIAEKTQAPNQIPEIPKFSESRLTRGVFEPVTVQPQNKEPNKHEVQEGETLQKIIEEKIKNN
ncbi:MAG: hypothetical protein AAB837_02715 [Patescibacteria group bacterium]